MIGRAERWYARALRLLPAGLRAEYGADMLATFRARAQDARAAGRLGRFLARELGAVAVIALAERLARMPRLPFIARHRAQRRKAQDRLDQLARELRHSVRRLMRSPGFTAAVLLTLALAIGANVAIFTLVERIVIAPLPYPDQHRLVSLTHSAPGIGMAAGLGVSTGLYREYSALPSVERMALYSVNEATLGGVGDPERLRHLAATPSLGDVLGTPPALGRWFTAAEGAPGGERVAILTHDFWATRFGSDPGVLGRTIRLDGVVREVVGVMPVGFAFPDPRVSLIVPLQFDLAAGVPTPFNHIGLLRIAPDVTVSALNAQLAEVIAQLPARFPEHAALTQTLVGEAMLTPLPVPMKERVLGGIGQTLWVLLGSVATLLLIACANLANLFLARMDARQRELALRRALGAGTGRIVSYHLAETLLLALASGVIGLVMAWLAVELLVSRAPIALPRLHEVAVGATAVGYTLLLALLAGFGFGALQLLRRGGAPATLLKEGGRTSTAGARSMQGRQLLVLAQVSMAVVLLIAAGLMVQSFLQLQRVDPGFRTEQALVFRIGLPASDYRGGEHAAQFQERLLERVGALPGVTAAGFATMLPLDGEGWGDPLHVRGAAATATGHLTPMVHMRSVSPGLFETLGIPLRHGRLLGAEDARGHYNTAVINEALAELYFAGEDPIGREVRPIGAEGDDWFTVVGVVGNTVTSELRETSPAPLIYYPHRTASTVNTPPVHSVSYVVRTSGEPLGIVAAVRRVVAELDPNLAIAGVETLTDRHASAAARTAFMMLLLVVASVVALVLGLVGVYAVISFAVTQRTPEIGVRLALGARPGEVTRMIMGQSGRIIAFGVAAGLLAAAATGRMLQGLLFGIEARDVTTYAIVAIGLFATALIACWVPAQRAARVSPMESLNDR